MVLDSARNAIVWSASEGLPYILGASALLGTSTLIKKVSKRIQYVGRDEQLVVKRLTEKVVYNGPCVVFPSYMTTLSYKKRKAVTLDAKEYVAIRDETTGEIRHVAGPALEFLGAYDEVIEPSPRKLLSLGAVDGVIVENTKSGEQRLVKGPRTFLPTPDEAILREVKAISLKKDEYLRLMDNQTGRSWTELGEQLAWLQPHYVVKSPGGKVENALSLKPHQFVRLQDRLTGKVRVVRGPSLVFPEASERTLDDGGVMDAIHLKPWQYTVIQDLESGQIRVERGEKTVWLSGSDHIVGSRRNDAVRVDAEVAVLVRNRKSGTQHLVIEPQMFIPNEDEEVVEIRKRIKLADNEAVVLKDGNGQYHFRYGDDAKAVDPSQNQRSFFLPPHWELVSLMWSRGRRRERRDLCISIFDTRPQYMSFEFNCRTSDNVEMILEGTFFWEVVDLPSMLQFTGDAPGDVCSHARSCFIQLVSKVTLQEFMDTFNEIARKAHSNDDSFYKQRGIKIHSLEVTRYACADESTSRILQEIIQETTNRMNRLSMQESENEVALARLRGSVEQEKARSDVIAIENAHKLELSNCIGQSEAQQASTFIETLNTLYKDIGATKEDALANAYEMWKVLRKNDSLTAVSNGTAKVLFAPSDTKLSFDTQ